jgi:hypothetical protein
MAMMGRYGRWERRVLRPWFFRSRYPISFLLLVLLAMERDGMGGKVMTG